MIEIIEEKKIPYYECECYECGSRLRFTKKDVSLNHIQCPVCGCSVSVTASKGFEAGFYSSTRERLLAYINSTTIKTNEGNEE